VIPYKVDVAMYRWPVANFLILALMAGGYVGELFLPGETFKNMVLDGWTVTGLFGYLWLHGSIEHLVGNMIFLWVFGNAVCAKVGNLPYLLIFLGLGLLSGATHIVFDGQPAIGASGAINGIVGMFLVWYPLNELSCLFFLWVYVRTFTVSSIWMILIWFVFDILGAALGAGGIAYYAHLGGFVTGAVIAVALLSSRMVKMEPSERSLLKLLGLDKGEP